MTPYQIYAQLYVAAAKDVWQPRAGVSAERWTSEQALLIDLFARDMIKREQEVAKTTSVSLGKPFVDFIEGQVSSGRYGTASEVIREALRLLQDLETRRARNASGDLAPTDLPDDHEPPLL